MKALKICYKDIAFLLVLVLTLNIVTVPLSVAANVSPNEAYSLEHILPVTASIIPFANGEFTSPAAIRPSHVSGLIRPNDDALNYQLLFDAAFIANVPAPVGGSLALQFEVSGENAGFRIFRQNGVVVVTDSNDGIVRDTNSRTWPTSVVPSWAERYTGVAGNLAFRLETGDQFSVNGAYLPHGTPLHSTLVAPGFGGVIDGTTLADAVISAVTGEFVLSGAFTNGLRRRMMGDNGFSVADTLHAHARGYDTSQMEHWTTATVSLESIMVNGAVPAYDGWIRAQLPIAVPNPNSNVIVRLIAIAQDGTESVMRGFTTPDLAGPHANGVRIESVGDAEVVNNIVTLSTIRITEDIPSLFVNMPSGAWSAGVVGSPGELAHHIVRVVAQEGFRFTDNQVYLSGSTVIWPTPEGSNPLAQQLSILGMWLNPNTNRHEIYLHLALPARQNGFLSLTSRAFVDINGLVLSTVDGSQAGNDVALDIWIGTTNGSRNNQWATGTANPVAVAGNATWSPNNPRQGNAEIFLLGDTLPDGTVRETRFGWFGENDAPGSMIPSGVPGWRQGSWSIDNLAVAGFAPITGRIPFDGRYYQLFEAGVSWYEAQAYAESIGGHLATITSPAEQAFIETLIAQGSRNVYWLGGYRTSQTEFNWLTGEDTSFSNWAPGSHNFSGDNYAMMIYRNELASAGWLSNMWDSIPPAAFDWGFHNLRYLGFIVEWTDETPPEIIFSPNDIAVINAIIANNGLNATIANPADGSFVPSDWTFVTWSQNPRITELRLNSQLLTGILDVRGLDALTFLDASNNQLTSVNVTGLPALVNLDVRHNNMTSTINVIGLNNPPTSNFLFEPQNIVPDTGGGGGDTPQETPNQPADTTTGAGETYDPIEDPVPEIDPLSPEALDTITDAESAVAAAQNAVDHLIGDDTTLTADDLDLLAQFLENAIARAASMEIDGNLIIVNRPNVEALQDTAQEVVEYIEALLEAYDIELNRYLNTNVFFVTTDFAQVDVRVEPSAMLTDVDQVWIRTPYYGLSFSMEFIENNAHTPLYIHITSDNGDFTAQYTLPPTLGAGIGILGLSSVALNSPIQERNPRVQSYRIEFSRPISEPVRVSVPPVVGDRTFQTLQRDDGTAISSRYNQVTGLLDARVQHSGTYVVVENRVDFTDILHRSTEMQHAIRVLASQGILEGVAPLQFSPDDSINRAQFAAIIVRMLGIHDENADGGFTDVSRNDWFFSFAGSARQHGLMEGTGNNVFSPNMNMPNEQLVALGARILRTEARFRTPANPQQELQRFTDTNELASWSIDDLALAARENLIVPRADGRFAPRDTITRGDAALMLYRVYRRIW
ncbi:MAG: S-layer homology domain-containing protein [Defluviitaleaceae bacterium]|nr:S-layer homology domain-containing protein [Defluviitaleaceae bacterium]